MGILEGPGCVFEMELSSVSLDWRKLSVFLCRDEVEGFSAWKLGELCLLLAGDLFLYREVRSSFLADQDEEELVLFLLNCRKLSSCFR